MQKRGYTRLVSSRIFCGILALSVGSIVVALLLSPFSFAIVGSSSMSPSLSTGDILVWTAVDISNIAIGDIVVYTSAMYCSEEKIIVHRVVDITSDYDGEVLLATNGDAVAQVDRYTSILSEPYVRNTQILGKVVCIGNQPLKIPFIGMIGLLTK